MSHVRAFVVITSLTLAVLLLATCGAPTPILTPTPLPTSTSTPIPPTATATPEFTPTPAEEFHFSVPIVVEWHDRSDGQWWAEVGLTAWGGEGNYLYYVNYISEETEFFNGTFEIETLNCKAWWGTVIVISGDDVKKWEGRIPYPEPERCD